MSVMLFLRDRRGSTVTLFAFCAMILAVMTAIVMNQISFYMDKRRLQGAVDMAALIMMQSGNLEAEHARTLIETQTGKTGVEVQVVRGRYTPDAAVAAAQRFEADATPHNAIQVNASFAGDKVMMSGMIPGDVMIGASARVARRQTATMVVGSRLVRVEGGLSAALLDAALGYDGKLTVMDYNALAMADVDAVQFVQALNVIADIDAVTFDDALDANVHLGEVADALAATTEDGSVVALLDAASPVPGLDSFKLSSMIDPGSVGGMPLDALTSGGAFPISVGEVLAGSAALANGDNQIAVDLGAKLGDTSIASVSLDLGEKPQVVTYDAWAEKGATASTSQLRLNVGALGKNKFSLVAVDVQLASATVTIDDITCQSNGTAQVTVKAVTEAAKVGLKAPLLPKITIKAGSDEVKTLVFAPADIAAQTWKPVRSGLGLQVGPLSIAQKLLFAPVDAMLVKVGLHVAEADVKVIAANCGSAGLVH